MVAGYPAKSLSDATFVSTHISDKGYNNLGSLYSRVCDNLIENWNFVFEKKSYIWSESDTRTHW